MTERHKWADIIIAWANGATVQFRQQVGGVWGEWTNTFRPTWEGFGYPIEYRITPEPKPDVVWLGWVGNNPKNSHWQMFPHIGGQTDANVKFTYDGETGKLKAVEILK